MMIDKDSIGIGIPRGVAYTTMDILNPTKKVIIDMIMVQLLSLIMLFTVILITSNNKLSASELSYIMVGLFSSLLMLTGVYSRIAR
jgi:hypothetical protein